MSRCVDTTATPPVGIFLVARARLLEISQIKGGEMAQEK